MESRTTSAGYKEFMYFLIAILAIVLGWFCVFVFSN